MSEEVYNNLLNSIIKYQENGEDFSVEIDINGTNYEVIVKCPDKEKNINIPSIIAIPTDVEKTTIALESNNMESTELRDRLDQGLWTAKRLTLTTQDPPAIVVIPIIPSVKGGVPYYQQLSKECFEEEKPHIDEQVVNIINEVKNMALNKGISIDEKIFLNGYSSSGSFAQRFSLLHPELVKAACIGGSSGSIPIPTDDLSYPLGIKDYKQITGKEFDFESYKQILFTYYVAEFETINKTKRTLNGEEIDAPMHDMSYFDRSVPEDVGIKQRELYGYNLIARATEEVKELKDMGININHIIIPGKTHNNYSGNGVGDSANIHIKETYKNCFSDQKEDSKTL